LALLTPTGAVIFRDEAIYPATLNPPPRPPDLDMAKELIRPLAEVEQEAIESAMILCQGNITEASQRLEISREVLERKLAEYKRSDGQ